MKRILITGMSGTGKSSVIEALQRCGFEAVDTDSDQWCEWKMVSLGGEAPQPDWVWREDTIRALLERERRGPLFVSGCKSNQGKFYPFFDHVVLLRAPIETLLSRIAARENNPYGKSAADRAEIIANSNVIEPLLRSSCSLELDTRQRSLEQVTDELIGLIGTDGFGR